MTEKSRPELVLEAIRIFIWPTLIVFAVLWLGTDLKEILKSRTWKIGIVEVGDRISNLGNSLQNALLVQEGYLNKILANPTDTSKVKEYASQAIEAIENAQKGAKKDVQNIKEAIPQSLPPGLVQEAPAKGASEKEPSTAKEWETLGFKYLLTKNIQLAIQAFSQAEKLWPDYHNVSEISKLLVQNRGSLEETNSHRWKEIYEKIITQFSWGMPREVRDEMQEYIAGK